MKILNLTQHPATEKQKEEGLIDLKGQDLKELKKAITFDEMPTIKYLKKSSLKLADIAFDNNFTNVLIGGACYFMPILEKTLKIHGFTPYYAFSKRNAIDKEIDGKIITEYTFEHEGFIKM